MNIVLVVIDTLRRDHLGVNGNDWIRTPSLDAFAAQSLRLTRAFPESLPTLPVRRALHTGFRTFPYRGHRMLKGDIEGAPGWGPIPESQDTVSEMLADRGYRCALVTDTYHQFKPSKNFHRGFHEWIWVRGQEGDRWRSGPREAAESIGAHMKVAPAEDPRLTKFLSQYAQNVGDRREEEDYFPARVFSEASRWLRQNADAEKFFLVVDSFDPHEPWDPPRRYRQMYDADDGVADLIQSLYAPWNGAISERELKRLQGNYAGEVSLVDRWFGTFMDTLHDVGRDTDTLVAVISDHGHAIGYGPSDKGLVSKQGHPLTKSVAELVLMLRHPSGEAAGSTYDGLVYNVDLTVTLLNLAGIDVTSGMDGRDFWAARRSGPRIRDYVTIGWGPLMTVVTDEWWFNATIWGEAPLLYRLNDDPSHEHNLARERPDTCRELLELAVRDAGGSIPTEFSSYHGQPGCTPFEAEPLPLKDW
jgi:arylsulfatase A-like enzyme